MRATILLSCACSKTILAAALEQKMALEEVIRKRSMFSDVSGYSVEEMHTFLLSELGDSVSWR